MGETRDLLSCLSDDQSVKGLCDYAIIYNLITSGLRAAELCQLIWKDVEFSSGAWTARFIGKGEREAEQELYAPAVEAARICFLKQFGKEPSREDHLFYSLAAYNGDNPRPMTPHRLWVRVNEIGERAKAEGILTREIEFSSHLFRRTYATLLYKSGMKLKALAEKTRHSSIEILAKHYINDEEPASPYFVKMLEGVV